MKKILQYLQDYWFDAEKKILFTSTLFVAILIFFNYHFHINGSIYTLAFPLQFLCWYGIFLLAFSFPYGLVILQRKYQTKNKNLRSLSKEQYFSVNSSFILLFLIAPALFAWKMSFHIILPFTYNVVENLYWNLVFYWPFRFIVFIIILYIIWKKIDHHQPFYGWSTKNFEARPYFLMLLIMLPLVAAASFQHDFLLMYPKLKQLTFLKGNNANIWEKLMYELSYGSDFFSIELFFRGFLVLAFVRWFGKDAILPMACFYCTIHFGKPLGECISSFIGGLILGVITFHTRSIFGGLIVHLGIAWMMEVGGALGNMAK